MLETTNAAAGSVETACLADADFTGGTKDAESLDSLQFYSPKKVEF